MCRWRRESGPLSRLNHVGNCQSNRDGNQRVQKQQSRMPRHERPFKIGVGSVPIGADT